jgi:hypothetical protein
MSEIANAQAVRFCNERVRPLADLVSKLHRTIPQFLIEVQEYETYVADNVDGDVILDGAAEDGRAPLTKRDVTRVKNLIEALDTYLNADARLPTVQRIAVNPLPIF